MSPHTPPASPPAAANAIERPPRQSATVVLVRDGAEGLEVLLMERAERGDQNSLAWVFPGGLTDPRDREADGHARGLDDVRASLLLGLPSRGLDFALAAVRECFEEAGLLFTHDPLPPPTVRDDWRGAMQRGERSLAEFCAATGVSLALDGLCYFSRWVTPPIRPKRFDTRFFLARAPVGQEAEPDGHETIAHRWIRPAEALAPAAAMKMLTPTVATLRLLARYPDVGSLWAWATTPREVELTIPAVGRDTDGQRVPVAPDEPPYAELLRLDPARTGSASCRLLPGQAVRLSERVIRVTANNGSIMTGPGTNTYLVAAPGAGADAGWAVIDPGPADPLHVEAVLAAAPGPIRWIFVTHTHSDHSPACLMLKQRTGARSHGRVADHPQWQDASFVPDVPLAGGESFDLGERVGGSSGATLRVIHTPGHASNHLCFLLEEEKTLFTGDHVMQGSTVVINPPDGDMAAYVASLTALQQLELDWLAPGHGFLMDRPRQAMQAIVAHRLAREAKVHAAVAALGPAPLEALLARVYADVPPKLHAMALRSLTAHLLKLQHDGRCRGTDRGWEVTEAG